MTEFWSQDTNREVAFGVKMELKAKIALDMLLRYTFVTVRREDVEGGEGKGTLDFQSPEEIVDRAFAIAGLFIERGLGDKVIKPHPSASQSKEEYLAEAAIEKIISDPYRLTYGEVVGRKEALEQAKAALQDKIDKIEKQIQKNSEEKAEA